MQHVLSNNGVKLYMLWAAVYSLGRIGTLYIGCMCDEVEVGLVGEGVCDIVSGEQLASPGLTTLQTC